MKFLKSALASKRHLRAVLIVLLFLVMATVVSGSRAFSVFRHETITAEGLAQRNQFGGASASFLRPAVLEDIANEHEQQDEFLTGSLDELHFDDCSFIESIGYINSNHQAAARMATPGGDFNPWQATDDFGQMLHTVMDFYSHSNWVELGFPQNDNPLTERVEVTADDLVDLSNAPLGSLQPWFAPASLSVVRDDILVHGDDDFLLPSTSWSVDEDFPGPKQATLRDGNGSAVGRLLTTGKGFNDHECVIRGHNFPEPIIVWRGFEHDADLQKDAKARPGHYEARALATLQTSYEWCRFIFNAGLENGEGLPIALWPRPDASPHPDGTPCGPQPPGREEVTVTVDKVLVLDSGDDSDNQPGEINLVLAIYDSPFEFHQSARSQSLTSLVNDGKYVSQAGLPPPVSLCLDREDVVFHVAVHGWDDDNKPADEADYRGDYDNIDDNDETLVGFQKGWGLNVADSTHVETSADLEITYSIQTGTDSDGDGLGDCDEAIDGTDASDADSDDDGLSDGVEVNGANPTDPLDDDSDDDGLIDGTEVGGSNPTDPLDDDSDEDGLTDGAEDANHNGALDDGETDPNKADSDNDGLDDGIELGGSNPTDPLDDDSDKDGLMDGTEDANHNGTLDAGETDPNDADSDDDQLSDGEEVAVGTNPLNPDSDGDGIADGQDVDWLGDAFDALPQSAFRDSGGGLRTASLLSLDNAEKQIAAGRIDKAVKDLEKFRTKLDGCGARADKDDWIVDCDQQVGVRGLLDLLLANLRP